ncbi:hemicentin-1-like [Gadus macrocephalus]|uniref:hemicentin-1-like n=1 Tax=Gadus macrocephalus TaxID=80720 RepID=UPI0028CB51C6|nr:hemicentin-1-like [Gadus macrocephalus]
MHTASPSDRRGGACFCTTCWSHERTVSLSLPIRVGRHDTHALLDSGSVVNVVETKESMPLTEFSDFPREVEKSDDDSLRNAWRRVQTHKGLSRDSAYEPLCYYFDYWGKGTVVTVSDSAVQAPNVFPLVQCGSGTGEVTIGCMATGFTPASLTFKWEFGGSELADAVQYPTSKKDNQYTGVSQIRVRRQDWDTQKPFTCSAVNAGGTAKADVFKQVERVIPPNITLYPVWTGQSWASELSLVCSLSGFYPDKVSVEWLLDGRVPETSPVQNKLQSVEEVGKTFTLNSKIQLKMEEWKKGPNVQCKSKYGHGKEETRNINICDIYSYPPSVHLTTPSFKTVIEAGSDVTAACVVHTAFDVNVTWHLDGKALTTPNLVTEVKEGALTRSNLTVSPSHWKKLNSITCRAEHCFTTVEKNMSVADSRWTTEIVERVIPPNITLYPVWTGQSWASELSLVCSLSGFYPDKVSVEWLLDGRVPETSPVQNKLQSVEEGGKTFTLNSKIQLKMEEWKKGPTVQCKSKYGHGKEETRNISICDIYSYPPSVHLMTPSFKTVIEAGSDVTAACVVHTAFDVNVTWHLDGKALTTPNLVTEVKEGALTRSNLTVSSSQWKKLNSITCRAEHCFTTVEKNMSVADSRWTTEIVERVIPPNITLYPVWTGQSWASELSLVCSLSGFYPDKVSVEWLLDGRVPETSPVQNKLQSVEEGGKTFTLNSKIQLKMEEWKKGPNVQCKSKYGHGKEETRNISICDIYSYPPSVHLTTPSFKTVIEAGSDVTAACVVHTAFDVNVTWHLDGKALTTPNLVTEVKEGALTRSNLTVSSSQWKKLNSITCRAEHCFTTVEKNMNVAGSLSHSQPSALLLQGPNELVCLAYGFSPASINITWLLDGTTQLRSYNTTEPHRGPKGKFSIQSRLPLSPNEWLPGQMYTCRVNHCNGNIALNMSKPEILEESVLFDENKQVFVQDMGEDNWMMTITFLLLFFVSLFYGILVTVIKTK